MFPHVITSSEGLLPTLLLPFLLTSFFSILGHRWLREVDVQRLYVKLCLESRILLAGGMVGSRKQVILLIAGSLLVLLFCLVGTVGLWRQVKHSQSPIRVQKLANCCTYRQVPDTQRQRHRQLASSGTSSSSSSSSSSRSSPEYFVTIGSNGNFLNGCQNFFVSGWNQYSSFIALATYCYELVISTISENRLQQVGSGGGRGRRACSVRCLPAARNNRAPGKSYTIPFLLLWL